MGKTELGSLCFTVTGEFLTQHFRERWVDGYDPEIPLLFMQSMIGMGVDHVSLILSGKKKLIGDSSTEIVMVDDDADECIGNDLLSIDAARQYGTMLTNLATECNRLLRSCIDVADLNGTDCRGVSKYGGYIDHMESYLDRLKLPRDFARMVKDHGTQGFWSFITQLVGQSYSEITRITQDGQYDYIREYEQDMSFALKSIKTSELAMQTIKDTTTTLERPELAVLQSIAIDATNRLAMAGMPNAAKYKKAAEDKLAGKSVNAVVKAKKGEYAKVEFGFLTPAGELYLCGFFEHNDLQELLIDAGLWVDHQMVSLKQGTGSAKMWYKEDCDSWDLPKEERGKLSKKPTKEQELTILQWCEENKVSFNDCAMHLFDY